MLYDYDLWLFTRDSIAKLDAVGRKVGRKIILFDTPQAAENVAFMLRGDWDGCNSVSFAVFDDEAIVTAAALEQAE